MGDRDFALQLLEELQTQFPGELESLSACLDDGALQDVVRLAHTFKGLAANVAADGLRDAAFQLEQSARLADFTAARQRMETVRLEWDRLNAYLTDEFLTPAR